MKKTTYALKTIVIALALLFIMALVIGITSAAYNTSRTADGSLSMANGIVIDYSGFGKAQDGEWEKEQTTTFKLFANRDILPGDTINLNSAAIKKGTNSIDFYARIKFEYKFYDALDADITATVGNEYTNFISTPAFNSAWVNGNNNDGWFYYATGTTLNTLPASFVNIFSSSAINVELNVAGFNHEGGGYKFTDTNSNEITITKIEATLTLEALQTTGSTWEINPLIQNSNSQVVEIYSNEITLGNVGGAYKLGTGEAGSLAYDTTTLGTTLKIVVAGDSQINANAFDGSDIENVYIGDADYISGVSSYSAKIYTTPATFTIGANAFAGCTNLNLYLSSNVNYTIYTNAIPSTATVYYNGNIISLPSSAGEVDGTTITMVTPSVVSNGGTGGSGAGSVNHSNNVSYGAYTYEDEYGNIWYFDLGTLGASIAGSGDRFSNSSINVPDYSYYIDNLAGTSAIIRHCDMSNKISLNQSFKVPSFIFKGELNGGMSVVCIAGYDFNSCIFDVPNLIGSVEVSEGIISIDDSCFRNCSNILSIALPDSLKKIGPSVFSGCSNLSTIILPVGIEIISSDAFCCTKLTCINIPSSIKFISETSFNGCSLLEQFDGGNNNYIISDDHRCIINFNGQDYTLVAIAFGNLDEYIIPDGITRVGICDNYFSNYGLRSITFSNTVEKIGFFAFYSSNIEYIRFKEGRVVDLEILDYAFMNCSQLTTVVFEDSNININVTLSDYVFSGCTNLQSITFPDGSTYPD